MARILVMFKDKLVREVPLGDSPLRIGRDPSCEIQLDNLAVSRQHAAILPHRTMGFILEDLDSRNGTLLNGNPLAKRSVLVGGDRIGVGKHELIFRVDPETPAKPPARSLPCAERTIPLAPAPGKRDR